MSAVIADQDEEEDAEEELSEADEVEKLGTAEERHDQGFGEKCCVGESMRWGARDML